MSEPVDFERARRVAHSIASHPPVQTDATDRLLLARAYLRLLPTGAAGEPVSASGLPAWIGDAVADDIHVRYRAAFMWLEQNRHSLLVTADGRWWVPDWSPGATPYEAIENARRDVPLTTPTPAREPVAWKIIDERFTSGGILTQNRAEMEQLAKNPSALIMPLVPLMDPPAAPTTERSEGAGVADIVKLYAMRDNAELDAVLAGAVRRGLKSVEVPNGILGTIRYELPPTPEAGTVTEHGMFGPWLVVCKNDGRVLSDHPTQAEAADMVDELQDGVNEYAVAALAGRRGA